ncbi:MAG: HAD family hydrolase [Bacteroidota bacterium]
MKRLIILDIDETFLHSTYSNLKRDADFSFKERQVYLRPGLSVFMDFCFENFDVAVWTSAKAEYAKYVLKRIAKDLTKFKFIWTRKDCDKDYKWNGFSEDVVYVKNLNKIAAYPIHQITIIDDKTLNIFPVNADIIGIDEYFGSETDDALMQMIEKLKGKLLLG